MLRRCPRSAPVITTTFSVSFMLLIPPARPSGRDLLQMAHLRKSAFNGCAAGDAISLTAPGSALRTRIAGLPPGAPVHALRMERARCALASGSSFLHRPVRRQRLVPRNIQRCARQVSCAQSQ